MIVSFIDISSFSRLECSSASNVVIRDVLFFSAFQPSLSFCLVQGSQTVMDLGRDPGKGTSPSLELIVSWLLAVNNSITFDVTISTARREFVVARGCT